MKRFVILFAVLLLVALGVFLLRDSIRQTLVRLDRRRRFGMANQGIVLSRRNRMLQPPYDTADFAPVRYSDYPRLALNTFLEQEVEEAKVRRQRSSSYVWGGFAWIRQEFPWEDPETRQGPVLGCEIQPEHLGRVRPPRRRGRVNMGWTWSCGSTTRRRGHGRTGGRGRLCSAGQFRRLWRFRGRGCERYRGKIRFYQFWNEPNIYPDWGEQDVNPAEYVRLLKIGYTRAKAADPNCVIFSAGLAQTVEEGGRRLNDRFSCNRCTMPARAAILIFLR